MEDDAPEVETGDNLNLIQKPGQKPSSDTIPMQKMTSYRRHSRDPAHLPLSGTSPQSLSDFGATSPPTNTQPQCAAIPSKDLNQNQTAAGAATVSEANTEDKNDKSSDCPDAGQNQVRTASESVSPAIRDSIISSISSPDPFSSVWVLASSQFNLASNEPQQGSQKWHWRKKIDISYVLYFKIE